MIGKGKYYNLLKANFSNILQLCTAFEYKIKNANGNMPLGITIYKKNIMSFDSFELYIIYFTNRCDNLGILLKAENSPVNAQHYKVRKTMMECRSNTL